MLNKTMFKQAHSPDDLSRTQSMMRRIYEEDPSFWPHGLSLDQFDTGGLYMISKSASEEPVGFVGWQARPENGRKVGYYAIGVLPEHRKKGFAKQAVASLLRKKASEVDEVRALVMSHNIPSKNLASALNVTVLEKSANKLTSLLGALTGGATTAGLIDLAVNKDKGAIGAYALGNEDADRWTAPDFLLNAGAGAAAAPLWKKNIPLAAAMTGLAAGKTIATPAVRSMQSRNDTFDKISESVKALSEKDDSPPLPGKSESFWDKIPKSVLFGAGGLGLGALGIAAYKAKKDSDHQERLVEEQGKGRVRVTLPTKQPGDSETQLEIPIEEVNLSDALRSRIGRDTRRRLYAETRARTQKRKPKDPKNLTDKEKEDRALEEEGEKLDKTAALTQPLRKVSAHDALLAGLNVIHREKFAMAPPPGGAPNMNVPSPPVPGQNPAVRQQQQAQANSMPPATDANPHIMKAEQAAVEAQQQGAQQLAMVEQQAQAAQMDAQQKFQAELGKKQQENDTLKLQLEKQKAEADLAKQKSDASEGATGGDLSTAMRMTQQRLSRIGSRVKSANNAGAMPAMPTPVTPTPVKRLKPGAGQRVNNSPAATKLVAPIGVYRHSYGPVGDWLYNAFFRKGAITPGAPARMSRLGFSDMINSPDKLSMIENLYKQ